MFQKKMLMVTIVMLLLVLTYTYDNTIYGYGYVICLMIHDSNDNYVLRFYYNYIVIIKIV